MQECDALVRVSWTPCKGLVNSCQPLPALSSRGDACVFRKRVAVVGRRSRQSFAKLTTRESGVSRMWTSVTAHVWRQHEPRSNWRKQVERRTRRRLRSDSVSMRSDVLISKSRLAMTATQRRRVRCHKCHRNYNRRVAWTSNAATYSVRWDSWRVYRGNNWLGKLTPWATNSVSFLTVSYARMSFKKPSFCFTVTWSKPDHQKSNGER